MRAGEQADGRPKRHSLPVSPQITSVWAAALALLFVILSARALLLRRKLGIALGDAGNETLHRAIRVHSNFAEYVPLTLLLALLLELGGARALLVHAVCCLLLLGRVAHAYGVSKTRENFGYRVAGMALTLTALGGVSVMLLLDAL